MSEEKPYVYTRILSQVRLVHSKVARRSMIIGAILTTQKPSNDFLYHFRVENADF